MFQMLCRTRFIFESSMSRILCLSLIYTLFISFCAPFITPFSAEAGSRGSISGPLTLTKRVPSTSQRRVERREGEVLVRFREGTAEQEKTALAASKGARRGRGCVANPTSRS